MPKYRLHSDSSTSVWHDGLSASSLKPLGSSLISSLWNSLTDNEGVELSGRKN